VDEHERPRSAAGVPLARGSGPIVISIAILVALATVSGFMLGQRRLRWVITLAVGIALAILSAVVQQSLGFEAPIGIPVTVACLALNQGAYIIGFLMGDGEGGLRSTLPQHQANESPSDLPNDDVRHEREWQSGDEGSRAEVPIGRWLHAMMRTARGVLAHPINGRIAIAGIAPVGLR
jgi:hypothetical protein